MVIIKEFHDKKVDYITYIGTRGGIKEYSVTYRDGTEEDALETELLQENKPKNVNAIDKIIAELAKKDFLAYNPLKADGTRKYKKHRPYTLSAETNEAREIKYQYLADEITEEEYKAYCLRYNLSHK